MKRPRRKLRIMLVTIVVVLIIWTGLTIWAQYFGKQFTSTYGEKGGATALIVYNPDPIYDLDKQVCISFAEGLAESGFHCRVSTIKFAEQDKDNYNLYVFCANTYNWSPDWLTRKLVLKRPGLRDKDAVAITLGSGSTGRARRKLEESIKTRQMNLIDSKTFWLMRPNDETQSDKKNVRVANEMAKDWGIKIGRQLVAP